MGVALGYGEYGRWPKGSSLCWVTKCFVRNFFAQGDIHRSRATKPRAAWHLDVPTFYRHAPRIGVAENSRESAQRHPRKRAPRIAEFESAAMSPPKAIPRPMIRRGAFTGAARGSVTPSGCKADTGRVPMAARGLPPAIFSQPAGLNHRGPAIPGAGRQF